MRIGSVDTIAHRILDLSQDIKQKQEAKKKETKEVSAAAMNYFSYILGYK